MLKINSVIKAVNNYFFDSDEVAGDAYLFYALPLLAVIIGVGILWIN